MRLGYVILYVPDVSASLSFYEQAFALKRRFLHESNSYGELETGATTLAFAAEALVEANGITVRVNRVDDEPAAAEVGFLSEDVPEAYAKALATGAYPYKEPARKPWGQTVAYVRDLNGFIVEICTPMSG